MNVDSIRDGIVIDHISAGCGMKLYRLLGLETMEAPVALPKASLVAAYDSWAAQKSQFRNRDYWFDNWTRTNLKDNYPGIKPAWASPWLTGDFSADNTDHYRQAARRSEYRQYVANPYYLSAVANEASFLATVFAICGQQADTGHNSPRLLHNAASDAHIAIHIPYNKVVKDYLSPNMKFDK